LLQIVLTALLQPAVVAVGRVALRQLLETDLLEVLVVVVHITGMQERAYLGKVTLEAAAVKLIIVAVVVAVALGQLV
jgi:hypothetical protein